MVLRKTVEDREHDKFTVCDLGETAVRSFICNTVPYRPTGLNNGGLITEVVLNDLTWTALPASALSDRNAMAIQNLSTTDIKLNYDNTVVGYVGVLIPAGGERFYDITDQIPLYAKAEVGNPTIVVEEIS